MSQTLSVLYSDQMVTCKKVDANAPLIERPVRYVVTQNDLIQRWECSLTCRFLLFQKTDHKLITQSFYWYLKNRLQVISDSTRLRNSLIVN